MLVALFSLLCCKMCRGGNAMSIAETESGWTDQGRLLFLLEAARQFGSTLDEQRIYASLQRILSEGMPLDGLIVSSIGSDGLIRCDYAWSDGQVLDTSLLPPVKLNIDGSGMQSRVIVTGKAQIFDVGAKIREPNTSYVQLKAGGSPIPIESESQTKSAIMAPMALEGRVTGVVQAMSDRQSAYSEEDLGVFEAVVLQMTAAWHHARLYRKAEEDRHMIDRIVSTSPDLIYVFDLRTAKSTFSNGQMGRFLGYLPDEFKNLTLQDLVHPDDCARLPDIWNAFQDLPDGETRETEYRVRDKSGTYRWFLNLDTPFERDEQGRVVRILGFGRDVTSRKQLEGELEARVAERTCQLEEAVKELEGFTYSVSHDLRGPLRAISASSMILREDYGESLSEEGLYHLNRQAEAAKKMGALIDDLLKLSRIGRQQLSPTLFDISEAAREVAVELGGVERIEIESGLQAFGDPRLIHFVLLNLMENALKFSPDGGTVRFQRRDGTFLVRDDGIGFDMQYAPKLFRPFERLVRDEDYPGTGIGLANAHRIVTRHGGRIWVESEPGNGSTFFFTLPRQS